MDCAPKDPLGVIMETVSTLDPERTQADLEDGVIQAVKSFFPYVGTKQTLHLRSIYPDKSVSIDDISAQKRARQGGRTWAKPIYGSFDLVDNKTGAVISSTKKTRLLNLPHYTRRYSFVVEGKEYQADNQWRLKAGAYTRRKANGELETQFNLSKGRGFKVAFDPTKRKFLMNVGTTNVPLLPVLQSMGVSDADIKAAWGPEVFAAAASHKKKGQLTRLAKVLDKRNPVADDVEASATLNRVMGETELRADTTKITLGKGFSKVTGESLLLAANKLLGVSRGTAEADNRDSLRFKELWDVADHLPERILNSSRRIQSKIRNNINRKTEISKIVSPDIFNVPVKSYFTSTSLSQLGTQVNPIDMVGGHLRATIMGQGGISSDNAVGHGAKLLDSSQFGFVDPFHTPEGGRSGITTHLTLGVGKRGKDPVIQVWDVKQNKQVSVSPTDLSQFSLAFADQYKTTDGGRQPLHDMVTVIPAGGGDPAKVAPEDVDYILRSPRSMFSLTANIIPFLASDQAGRAGMAARHLEQAVSLKNREEPLVQVLSGNPDKSVDTWEKILGKFNSHNSPVSGTVVAVEPSRILVQDKEGKKHVVQTYDNFPLNEKKAFLSSTALVKKGDTVLKGDVLADTNFTRGGVFALGTNMRIGYLPFKGLVFEDGIVVSETGAEKLTSEQVPHVGEALFWRSD